MSKSLALISGKGGSGKTSLALSMASMLSNCNLNVLLIDCDMSTNGATYFFEGKLEKKDSIVSSFDSFFSSENNNISGTIKINDHWDFLPSIEKINGSRTKNHVYKSTESEERKNIFDMIREKYDVIIYDCQAGYTDILRFILPFVDINLLVMEADAISSSSVRNLLLKLGSRLKGKTVYQVFNKATEEEFDIYSKISAGTYFTNIETVMFDWKIRKAFALAQIPDMDRTSARYGEQVYNICSILFKEDYLQEKLKKYELIIERNRIEEEQRRISEVLSLRKETRKKEMKKNILMIYIIVFILLAGMCVYSFLSMGSHIEIDLQLILFIIFMLFAAFSSIFLTWVSFLESYRGRKYRNEKFHQADKRLYEIEERKGEINSLLQKYDK